MPSDRENNGDPASLLPELAGVLRPPDDAASRQTLAGSLIPVVDAIRALPAALGVRPYRVFLVHLVWSGGEVGVGQAVSGSRIEITPTPRVRELGSVDSVVRSTGSDEEGVIEVDRISARFTEDDLLGRTADLRDPNDPRTAAAGVEFFWEVRETRPSTPGSVIRRFAPQGVPERRGAATEWSVRLVRQDYDRGRAGGTDRGDF